VPEGMTMAQFPLRWILMFDAVTCAIPGAKRHRKPRTTRARLTFRRWMMRLCARCERSMDGAFERWFIITGDQKLKSAKGVQSSSFSLGRFCPVDSTLKVEL